jgi:hypothetical protein
MTYTMMSSKYEAVANKLSLPVKKRIRNMIASNDCLKVNSKPSTQSSRVEDEKGAGFGSNNLCGSMIM